MPVQICESILSLPQFCVAYPTLPMPSSQMPPLHASLCAPTEACAQTKLAALLKRQRLPWTLATCAPSYTVLLPSRSCSTKMQQRRQMGSHYIVALSALDELSHAHQYVSLTHFFFFADQLPLLLAPFLPPPSSTDTEAPPSSCHSWTPHVCTCSMSNLI